MTYPAEIESYVQGYRFSDDPDYYDSASQTFRDLAGYGPRTDLVIDVGTPTFVTSNSQRGMQIDNTAQGVFPSPIAAMGSVIIVVEPVYVSGANNNSFICIGGDAASSTANGLIWFAKSSGNRILYHWGPNGTVKSSETRTDENMVALAFAFDQETRKAYSSVDGATVTATSALAGTTNGNSLYIGSAVEGMRFGNSDAVAGSTTAQTEFYTHLMEMHFFSKNILVGDDLAKTQGILTRLKAKYTAS